jgi:hypothetical protein
MKIKFKKFSTKIKNAPIIAKFQISKRENKVKLHLDKFKKVKEILCNKTVKFY